MSVLLLVHLELKYGILSGSSQCYSIKDIVKKYLAHFV